MFLESFFSSVLSGIVLRFLEFKEKRKIKKRKRKIKKEAKKQEKLEKKINKL